MLKMNPAVLTTIRQITNPPRRTSLTEAPVGTALPKLPPNARLGTVDGHLAVSTLVVPARQMTSMTDIKGKHDTEARRNAETVEAWFLSAVVADPSLEPYADEIELQAGLDMSYDMASVSAKGLELIHIADPVNAKAKQAEQVLIKKFKLQPLR